MVVVTLLSSITAGCATLPRSAPRPCLPPGISADVFLWPVVETGTVGFLPVEGGGIRQIVYVVYQRANRRVAVGWAGGQILIVDPEPDSNAAPWFNEALITGNREIRTAPAEQCTWSRPTDTQA
jgi:hypothetical protein